MLDATARRPGKLALEVLRFTGKIGILGTLTVLALPLVVAWIGRRFSLKIDRLYLPVLLPGMPHIVWMRQGSSDYDVLRQIFVIEEFRSILDRIPIPDYIVDCGANAGYASLYFLRKFPAAHLTAIEPESANVRICQDNLKHFGDQVSIVEAGVWTHDGELVVEAGVFADGREWATRVRAAIPGEKGDVRGVNIGTILDTSGFDEIGLLKIDIEHAEAIVFSSNFEAWLPRVRNIVIELHDAECERTFFAALAGYTYHLTRQGNLSICTDMRPGTAPTDPIG